MPSGTGWAPGLGWGPAPAPLRAAVLPSAPLSTVSANQGRGCRSRDHGGHRRFGPCPLWALGLRQNHVHPGEAATRHVCCPGVAVSAEKFQLHSECSEDKDTEALRNLGKGRRCSRVLGLLLSSLAARAERDATGAVHTQERAVRMCSADRQAALGLRWATVSPPGPADTDSCTPP